MKHNKKTRQPKRDRRGELIQPQKRKETKVSDAEWIDFQGAMVMGRHPVLEALRGDRKVFALYLQEGIKGQDISDIIELAEEKRISVERVDKQKLDDLVYGGNHQGVLLDAEEIPYANLDELFEIAKSREEDPFFVLLDGIEDPHNLGSVLRTADATGVHGVIIPKRRAVGLTSTVVKAAAGAAEHVRIAQVTNMARTIDELKERGVWVFGTDMAGTDYRQWNSAGPIALVIGSEGEGMSRLVKEKCDGMVTIPMKGHVQSLNASVAAGLLMYEVARERS